MDFLPRSAGALSCKKCVPRAAPREGVLLVFRVSASHHVVLVSLLVIEVEDHLLPSEYSSRRAILNRTLNKASVLFLGALYHPPTRPGKVVKKAKEQMV